MSAIVIDFASAIARRRPPAATAKPATPPRAGALTHDFTFWQGATGARYVHTVYSLLECPELPNANVLLVRRHAFGTAEVLKIACLEHGAPSLNLANARHTAAMLGANEIHVHLLADNPEDRRAIARDLLGVAEPASVELATRH